MFVLVMGVSGSGKSTAGRLLAERLGLAFHDADDYHPPENRAKMAADVALDDADRWPWLTRLAELSASWEAEGGAVLACSALKRAYRELLLQRVHAPRVVFLELSFAEAQRRLEQRRGQHAIVRDFTRILAGQYRDLEPPTEALTVSAELSPEAIVERAVAYLVPTLG
ncbi:MAG TPA: gluconokinase, GntK/IdnK-type [Polyangiaceae bacterium]|jgi:carbohydrate kinase (thermoresistant glucokinase family)|nr:gluconokinase, GntK/IdnK-type [Polyangiaceae bacterium]